MSKRQIVLIDGSSLAYRAFYSIGDLSGFRNSAGLHTNAIFSFKRMLDLILKKFDPTNVLVAFDKGSTTFRTRQYADYKGGREKTPSEFKEQMPYIRELLDYYGIKYYELADYEADDIIGTLSTQATEDDKVAIVTGDRDLMQLATDQATVYIFRRGASDMEENTPESIKESTGLTPKQLVEVMGLQGDPSDNIPGVDLVGEKKATNFIREYGSIDGLYENIDDLNKSKTKYNLINQKDRAYMSRDLATIVCDAPLEINLDETELGEFQVDKLVELYRQMDFNSFISQLYEDGYLESNPDLDVYQQPEYITEYVSEITRDYLPTDGSFYTETLDKAYHQAEVVGVAWSDYNKQKAYWTHPEVAFNSELFKNWLSDNQSSKVVLDSKREYVLVKRYGVELAGISFDASIASYLLDTQPNQEIPDILNLAKLPQMVAYDEAVYGKGKKIQVPDDEAFGQHLTSKVIALPELVEPLTEQLEDYEMWKLYREIEIPVAKSLSQMEITGIKCESGILEAKNQDLLERLDEIESQIHELAGEEFNVKSPKQLGEILFEKLKLPVIKKTKTGYSTAVDVLEKLKDKHPIIDLILDYRQLSKIQSTYLSSLPNYVQEDGKIHTHFDQTLTQTGRLSSYDPNLQNIPVRLEEGRQIRQAFVPAKKGWKLFSADYSQIELRVLAHISGDEHMIKAFKDGEDIHETTARRVFGIDPDTEVDPNTRSQAKAVNFGIVYGMSDYGLAQNLNISRKEAKEFIDTYFAKYPDIHAYMEEIVKVAKEKGYVKTLCQRRRYLPDLKSKNFNVRSFAERTAINTPIQGSAADIIKIAMVEVQKRLQEEGLKSRLLLQVHDELILEGPQEEMEILEKLIPEVMEGAFELSVPLKVDYSIGDSWYEL